MTRYSYAGKTAFVTGASSGIGREFALGLARRGIGRLILVARRLDALKEVQAEIERVNRVEVSVIAADLSVADADLELARRVAALNWPVDVLVNNAGFATYGAFDQTVDVALAQEEIRLNCASVIGLTAAFLPAMQSRGDGVIVNVASTAAFQPLPYMAVYGATKAFVLSFTEALWGENQSTGVRVLALCPGATQTGFFDRVGADEASVGTRQTPATVVAVAFAAIDRGRPSVISGRLNALMANAGRLATRPVMIRTTRRAMRPRSDAGGSNHRLDGVH
jgi:short-subunit dehydrogenase